LERRDILRPFVNGKVVLNPLDASHGGNTFNQTIDVFLEYRAGQRGYTIVDIYLYGARM
jgi:hypothetical protein